MPITEQEPESYVMGILTLDVDGAIKKVAELEKVSVSATSDTVKRTVSDQRTPREIIPTTLDFKIDASRAYTEPGIYQAMLDGKKLKGILYGKKPGSKKPVPLRDIRGFVINKVNLGDFDGKRHIVEDFGGECAYLGPADK